MIGFFRVLFEWKAAQLQRIHPPYGRSAATELVPHLIFTRQHKTDGFG